VAEGREGLVIGRGPPIDPGLRERFRAAEAQIQWRDAEPARTRPAKGAKPSRQRTPKPKTARVRIAHLHDEEARLEETDHGPTVSFVVDSGPVGALLVLLEMERRGPPALLTTRDAGESPEFPQGAIEARWDDRTTRPEFALPIADLIQLARYALA
jgi:hypothetical protein